MRQSSKFREKRNREMGRAMEALTQHPPPDHLLVHLSDTHLLGEGRKLFGQVQPEPALSRLMNRLVESEVRVEAVLFTGDLADRGEPDAYLRLRDLIEPFAERLGAKIFWTMGNHDEREPFYQILWREAPSLEPFDRVMMLGDLRIIILDSSVPGYHHGELSASQLQWLETQLKTPATHGTLLALHHPPIPTPIELMGLIELEDQALFAQVIRGTDVRAILAGHLHYSSFSTFAGVPVSVSAASCYNIDLIAKSSRMLSAHAGAIAASLVHVYPDQVVFSQIAMDDLREISSYDSQFLDEINSMSPLERRQIFSSKVSEFNQNADFEQSGF